MISKVQTQNNTLERHINRKKFIILTGPRKGDAACYTGGHRGGAPREHTACMWKSEGFRKIRLFQIYNIGTYVNLGRDTSIEDVVSDLARNKMF